MKLKNLLVLISFSFCSAILLNQYEYQSISNIQNEELNVPTMQSSNAIEMESDILPKASLKLNLRNLFD